MIDSTPAGAVDAALDYLAAALAGEPMWAETIANAHGTGRVARGLSALMVMLIVDAANKADADPGDVIETIRATYARRDATA